jgi:hypothetical protein
MVSGSLACFRSDMLDGLPSGCMGILSFIHDGLLASIVMVKDQRGASEGRDVLLSFLHDRKPESREAFRIAGQRDFWRSSLMAVFT